MEATIKPFETVHMARIAQLTNKSNQFNLTTRRYTQAEIEDIAKDNNFITIYGDLKDRFGDNGVVSLAIGKITGKKCEIILWLMSCRVLKRYMEFAMMDEMVRIAKEKGCNEIYGYYYPTEKNVMVKDFYNLQGYELVEEDKNGNKIYKLDISKVYENKNNVIKVVR